MFDSFAHYLSYGATDQQTARSLTGNYDGLVVPGTVAAFQSDGTRGFVLSLSASRRTRYVIDPRFPLFQQQLAAPKKSHESLAKLLGVNELINQYAHPVVEDFTEDRVEIIASNWLAFNNGYTEVSSKHFDKYAERLGEAVLPENRERPEYILPPYTVAIGPEDPWWELSDRLWQASVHAARSTAFSDRLVRVVCTEQTSALESLLRACPEDRIAVWVSGLDELDTTPAGKRDLSAYAEAIRQGSQNGQQLFALYGGFFSVLLASVGLRGSSHGIGYGEARAWLELPQSGPPPVRYYLPRAHRYVSQDLALLLWRRSRELVICNCVECEGEAPALLDYHALMRHSVRCRHAEINEWGRLTPGEAAEQLESDAKAFDDAIEDMDIPRNLRRQAVLAYAHLLGWAEILRRL